MPRPLLTDSQSDCLIQVVDTNLHTEWQTVQIQISWLLNKPTDLDLYVCKGWVYPGPAGPGLKIAGLQLKGKLIHYIIRITPIT